jgi:hypothetical protein
MIPHFRVKGVELAMVLVTVCLLLEAESRLNYTDAAGLSLCAGGFKLKTRTRKH